MLRSRILTLAVVVVGIVFLMLFLASREGPQEAPFGYWSGEGWVTLHLIPDLVAVSFRDVDTSPDIRAEVAKSVNALLTDEWLSVHGIAFLRLEGNAGLDRVEKVAAALSTDPRLVYAVPVFQHGTLRLIAGDELILRFRANATPERISAFLREENFELLDHRVQLVEYYQVRRAGGQGFALLDLAQRLRGHNLVESVSPNFVQLIPSSPFESSMVDPRATIMIAPEDSIRRDPDETTPALDFITPLAPNAGSWTELMIQGFESPTWQSGWLVFSDSEPAFTTTDPVAVSDAQWGRSEARAYTGLNSGWCAQSIVDPEISDEAMYVDDMHSWMVFGPFSLADATASQLRFRVWNDTAVPTTFHEWYMGNDYFPMDYMDVLFSTDGSEFVQHSAYTYESTYPLYEEREYAGWLPVTIDLSDLGGGLGDVTGQPAVWAAFRFRSGARRTDLGTYVDDVQLVKARPLSRRPISDDTYSERQWALRNIKQSGGTAGADIGAQRAWDISAGNEDVIVAVIDSGVDLVHEDLALVPGYDAVWLVGREDEGTRGGPRSRFSAPGDWHGTACAGIIAAKRDNARGIVGVAPGVSLMPVRMVYGAGRGWAFNTLWAIDAISWAVDHGAHVVSASWHAAPDPVLSDVIEAAVNERGVVMVFSTGNYGIDPRLKDPLDPPLVAYPASRPEVIAVGASSPCDERVSFDSCDFYQWESGYGQDEFGTDRWPDVVAPGVMSYTTDISGPDGYSTGDYYPAFGGTSAAVPHVAGVAALILSLQRPMPPLIVKQIITETAHDIDVPGRDRFTGAGRIDAAAALEAVRARRDDRPLPWEDVPREALEPGIDSAPLEK